MAKKRKPAPDDHYFELCHELLQAMDRSGCSSESKMHAMASLVVTTICREAPDRQTADDWHDFIMGCTLVSMNEAAERGFASWSRSRMQ